MNWSLPAKHHDEIRAAVADHAQVQFEPERANTL